MGKGEDSLTITNLAPFTVYGVTVLALNKEGESSLPSAGVKVVTHVDGDTAHVSNTNRWIYPAISGNILQYLAIFSKYLTISSNI